MRKVLKISITSTVLAIMSSTSYAVIDLPQNVAGPRCSPYPECVLFAPQSPLEINHSSVNIIFEQMQQNLLLN